ncbi:MAG: hypothetical protein LUE21_10380 [Oscillospiraceae bacterium]|nr:hypothetical protein [Oscillospiraceae bacterium]
MKIDRLLKQARALDNTWRGCVGLLFPSDSGAAYQRSTSRGLEESRYDSESAALAAAAVLRDNVVIIDI